MKCIYESFVMFYVKGEEMGYEISEVLRHIR